MLESARKTKRVVVAYEETHTGGFGAEIVATIAEEAGCAVQVNGKRFIKKYKLRGCRQRTCYLNAAALTA